MSYCLASILLDSQVLVTMKVIGMLLGLLASIAGLAVLFFGIMMSGVAHGDSKSGAAYILAGLVLCALGGRWIYTSR